MKVTLTSKEILVKFGLPADTELVIELGQDQDGDSGEWISNVGRNSYGHPESLDINAQIEVRFRDGRTYLGNVVQWGPNWKETDGYMRDIVAYRILKD